jgi:hypothetical protein
MSVAAATSEAPTAGQLVPLYQRLLTEKDARISELTTALEHEREQSRTWREALHRAQDTATREQTLRALDTMPPAPEAPQEARTEPESGPAVNDTRNGIEPPHAGEAGESEHQAGPGANGASQSEKAAGHEPAARRGWLARLLLRR